MLEFSTKANTLARLQPFVKKSLILPQFSFTVKELAEQPDMIEKQITAQFAGQQIIVRSSALSEDTAKESNAGRFLSLLNIQPENILTAAGKVADAFNDDNTDNQILVQPMLANIAMSGVLFTIDPNTSGNYFVFNYDETGSTDSVTSGEGGNLTTHYVFKGKKSKNMRLNHLIDAAEELIVLFSHNSIDIEFAYTNDDKLYILQARPLILTKPPVDYDSQQRNLERVHAYLNKQIKPIPYAKGNRTIYGVMPDWNPAEIIGIRPKCLALTLYRRLVTDGTWAYQRNDYGYKNLRSFPLMADFCGLPYIDTRVSFNSFIPKEIDKELSTKLADYYLDSLAAQPNKHDKVEFEIIFSCYTFDLPEKIKILKKHGFSDSEQETLKSALKQLTNNIINTKDGLWIWDTEKIDILKKRQSTIMESDLDTISKIYWLVEDCVRYGTLPFAGLARAGFVAVLLLKSLVSTGILTQDDYTRYMEGLNTISSQMSNDYLELSQAAFLEKYGHLRPGTYDIASSRYDAAPELYLGVQKTKPPVERVKNVFSLSLEQYTKIQESMEKQGLEGDVLTLFKFIKSGIEGREYSKFVFTRSLSNVLELLAELGAEYGFSREDMAFLDYSVIGRLYSSTEDIKSTLEKSIADGKNKYKQTLSLTMPPVILSADDIYSFSLPSNIPNYITQGEIIGEVCTGELNKETVAGKILLISAADPGFDWIFSCNISGFVTAYGGVNSHMAIRAGELGIPAVIGVGEKLFSRLQFAKRLHIDCANKKIEVI